MLHIPINKRILKALRPCISSWENYLEHHADFDGDFLEFLALDNIPAKDKIWVAMRVLPREIVEVFAIDCAVSAANHAAAAYAADAAYAAAAYAADAAAAYAYAGCAAAAAAAAAYAAESESQLDALAYLVINHEAEG